MRRPLIALAPVLLGACTGPQSALDIAGPAAERIGDLWWLMFWLSAVIYVAVMAALGVAIFRRRGAPAADAAVADGTYQRQPADERWGARWILIGGVIIPTVVLVVLFVLTMRTLGALDARRVDPVLYVDIEGERWWWRVRYAGGDESAPADEIISANELRIPVGRPVQLRLRSRDVIHSFWVPSLHGKMDLLPDRITRMWIQADRPGTFRGQCAEYCGLQHTNMALYVVAMPEEEFAAWYASQREPARPPADSLAALGADAFMARGCGSCHAIRGTPAAGESGPDLTHVGDRVSLAAGILPNTLGHLTGWIANPQRLKPGNFMPAVPLEPTELRAIAHYLQGLR